MTKSPSAWSRIEVAKEALNFSSAHFTIFSRTHRENLHGHNFRVACEVVAPLGDDDLCFDYGILKKKLKALCDTWDEKLLLPGRSPHLQVAVSAQGVQVRFGDETLQFLLRDVLVLPIANITVEGLSRLLLQLLRDDADIAPLGLREIIMKVSSGPGQWGVAQWRHQD